jgi:cytochrome b
MSAPASADPGPVRVWDPFVRLFHWTLALSVIVAWVLSGIRRTPHEAAGYVAAGLVAARVVWGFFGSPNARFASFVRGPAEVIAYLRAIASGTESRYLGHNPAGGVMIVTLLMAIAATALTGWMQNPYRLFGRDRWTLAHAFLGNAVLVFVGLHVAGVLLASWRHHDNLIRAMITGFKRPPGPNDSL